jgi:hypothetical protein
MGLFLKLAGILGPSPLTIAQSVVQWAFDTVGAKLTQASQSLVTKGSDLAIDPQRSTHAVDQGGGNLTHTFQAPAGAGVEAGLLLFRDAVPMGRYGPLSSLASAVWLRPNTVYDSLNWALSQNAAYLTINGLDSGVQIDIGTVARFYFSSNFMFPQFDNSMGLGLPGTRMSTLYTYGISAAGPITGGNNLPVQLDATAGALSVAASFALTNPQKQTPIIQLTGVVAAGNCVITLPNVVGGIWFFDVTGVTFGVNNLVFTTGAGTSATITGAGIVAGRNLLTVCVVASNFVSAGGA